MNVLINRADVRKRIRFDRWDEAEAEEGLDAVDTGTRV